MGPVLVRPTAATSTRAGADAAAAVGSPFQLTVASTMVAVSLC